MQTLKRIALALVIIGALNWGLIGLFDFDLVASLFGGQDSFLSKLIYSLVGLSGLISLSILFDRDSVSTQRNEAVQTGKLNYGTEFGEETDLSDVNKKS